MNTEKSISYGIGSVSQLTGLTTHTIRAWEQRYGAVRASRDASGRRRYGPADVERLSKLKRLVDLGERIGRLATLSTEALDDRLALAEAQVSRQTGPVRTGLFGPAARALGRALGARPDRYRVIAVQAHAGPADVSGDLPDVDCAVLDIASLAPSAAADIEELRRRTPGVAIVVLYGFARAAELRRLAAAGAVLVRSPASPRDLERAIDESVEPAVREPRAAATDGATRFTPDELERIASASTDIECECPHHLVALVRQLRAFEEYSAGCEDRNEADAKVHALLHRETVRANLVLEQALRYLIDYEAIEL